MFAIDDTLISDDLLEAPFACNLGACRGACCVQGDSGAPLEPEDYVRWCEEVVRATAEMVAHWMRVGFVHGVMNTDNLSILLRTDRIAVYPWRSTTPIQRQVTMEVIRFDRGEDDVVYLTALWSLYGKDGRRLLLTRKSTYRQAVAGPGAENVAAAMSTVVAELSREVADAIEK